MTGRLRILSDCACLLEVKQVMLHQGQQAMAPSAAITFHGHLQTGMGKWLCVKEEVLEKISTFCSSWQDGHCPC